MAKGVRPARMEVDCSGGELSCNGGSALLMMLAEQVRLFERASACFTDHRDPSKVAHPLVVLLGQRILGLALGYEDLNDHDELRRDRVPCPRPNGIRFEKSRSAPLRVFYNPLMDWDLFLFFWSVQKRGLRCDVFFGKLCCMELFRTESGWVRESWI